MSYLYIDWIIYNGGQKSCIECYMCILAVTTHVYVKCFFSALDSGWLIIIHIYIYISFNIISFCIYMFRCHIEFL